jgi:hypothetical protein
MAWDTSLAREISFTVRVAGVIRPHESLSWGQDITSDLPDAVTSGGQVAVRSGTIVWAKQQLVETSIPTPWYKRGYWLPATGETVTIDAHDGVGNTLRVFTGLIDTIGGDARGARSSQIVAEVERRNKVCRYGSLTRYGSPVPEPTGNGKIRQQATTPVWLVHEIVRDLGYSAVPPRPADSKIILDAPLQGSTYNYFQNNPNGEMVISHRPASDALAPIWAWGPDGFGISNALIEWVPRTGAGTGAGSVGISCVVFSAHTEDSLLTVTHGTSGYTYLRALGNGSVRVSTNVDGTTYAHVPAARFEGEGPHRLSVIFRGGQVHTRIHGVTETASLPTPSGAVTRVKLDAGSGSCVAGVQLWHPSSLTDHNAPGWVSTARFRYGTGTHSTILTPSIRDRKAREVLEEYADKLLSPIWIDGDGVLQVVTGKALHTQRSTITVNALSEVAELSYSMASLDHRPTVEVSYEHAHHTNPTATVARTTVWQGSGTSLDPGDTTETFVEVPDDEEWIQPDDPATMQQVTPDNAAQFQAKAGSWWGFSWDSTSGEYTTPGGAGSGVSNLVETLSPWAWKITNTLNPGTAVGVALKTANSSLFSPMHRNVDMPIIRSRSHVRYESRTVSATVGSDPYQGVLAHDTGKWITTTAAANDLCQTVHGMVATPTPVLKNLVIRFNPTVDVGRKITVKAQQVFGVDFEGLVLSFDHNPYDGTTTVIVRVTRVVTFADTLDAVDYAHIGQSLAAWDQARAGLTLDQVAADPYLT